ncbi:hypothetical protein KCU91_g15587, partial [Aureobasidium melanogenum]
MMPEDSRCQNKKRIRDDAFDPTHFPPQKRVGHNEDRPQGITTYRGPSADFAESTARSLSPDGGVAIDEETLIKFRSHVVLSCNDDRSDDSSQGGFHDDHQRRERPPGVKQGTKPVESHEGHSQVYACRQNCHDDQHNTNSKDQTAALPYASSLPVFNHQRGSYVVVSGSLKTTYQPFRGLESAQPPDSVTLNP